MTTRGPVRIVFASQTGCAEEVAHRIAVDAARQHFLPACCSIDEYDFRQLPTAGHVIFVVSTTGEGEVPDSMRPFWQFLLRRDLPAHSLAAVQHACFGLGDSSYPKFCYAAKRLHRRLVQLGSAPLLPLGLGDDQDTLGIDQAFAPWAKQLWDRLDVLMPLSDGLRISDETECPPPRYRVVSLGEPAECMTSVPPSAPATPRADASLPSVDALPSKRQPYGARVLANRLLTAKGCGREVRHIELDVSGWRLAYAPGDALAVQPVNPEAATLEVLHSLGLSPRTRIRVEPGQPYAPVLHWARDGSTTVLDLFARHLDLFGVPRRAFFALLAHFATDPAQRERLMEFGSVEGAADLVDYATRPRRTCAEVLAEFPSARPPLAYYLDLLPPMRERYFSIASSPLRHPTTVHIVVAVVRYQTRLQVPRFGVCSTYLASRTAADGSDRVEGDRVNVWLREGCLRMPRAASAPMVMVGPGTGVAPFRAFVQTRQAQRLARARAPDEAPAEGAEAMGAAILFFGCRRAEHDYLFAEEWQEHLRHGDLQHLHAAFSREPEQPKVYVQHRMIEPAVAHQLWALLAVPTCHVYVAGAANQMPKAVRKALRDVAMAHGGLDEDRATEWLRQLEAQKRLQCETW